MIRKSHKFDKDGGCRDRGNKAEEKFKKYIEDNYSATITFLNGYRDSTLHQDVLIEFENGRSITVDVKSSRKISRSDKEASDKYTWLEAHGVNKRNRGYILDGKADYIAFENELSWILVKRSDLVGFIVEVSTDENTLEVKTTDEALEAMEEHEAYTVYRRKGRFDKLILTPLDELRLMAVNAETLNDEHEN